MPINIYKKDTGEKIYLLCDDRWDLPHQIDVLEAWLKETGKKLKPYKYVADIGFDIRKEATGGGGVLSSEAMKTMGEIGMDIYLSEYPGSMGELGNE